MTLSKRLSDRRSITRLTQEQVAGALGVPRELISMWEAGTRTPSARQLLELGNLYSVTEGYLLGLEELSERHDREVLYRGLPNDPKIKLEVDHWLNFLDSWGEFVNAPEEQRLDRPPRTLDQGYETDARRAAHLAVEVRKHYRLGIEGAVDVFGFLEQLGVLVYRAPLGHLSGQDGVSGAFYNHPQLGWSVLVNAHMTQGRQVFTLAHELAHALFHYSKLGLVSRADQDDAEHKKRERFANTFAAHFLVPGKALRERLESLGGKEAIDELTILRLSHLFGVSYSMILLRLLSEKLIDQRDYDLYGNYRVQDVARRAGVSVDEYALSTPDEIVWDLERYPTRVLERVKRAVEEGELSVADASNLLSTDGTTLQNDLLSRPDPALEPQRRELQELWEVL